MLKSPGRSHRVPPKRRPADFWSARAQAGARSCAPLPKGVIQLELCFADARQSGYQNSDRSWRNQNSDRCEPARLEVGGQGWGSCVQRRLMFSARVKLARVRVSAL